jgi:ribonuclease E
MKTQLLEDIGQSAELSLPPPLTAGPPKAGKKEPGLVATGKAWSAQRRAAGGVWRQKPAEEPLAPAAQEPAAAPPLELREVFEEIAALEAQFVPPPEPQPQAGRTGARPGPAPEPPLAPPLESPHAPSTAPAGSDPAVALADTTLVRDPTPTAEAPQDPLFDFTLPLPASPAEPQREPGIRPTREPIPDWTPAPAATTGRDPLFDFTPPATPLPAADPFTPAAAGRKRSPRRYLMWAGCLLAAAVLVQGGRWLYQERADAGSLALVADQAKQVAPTGQARTRHAAAESLPAPGASAPAAPAAAVSSPASGVPPLVMLKPEEYMPRKEAQPSAPPKEREEAPPKPEPKPRQAPKPKPEAKAQAQPEPKSKAKSKPKAEPRAAPAPESAAKQRTAFASPKPAVRQGQPTSRATAGLTKEKRKREPVRQLAQASAVAPEPPAEPDTSMEALLKACREHGYHAAQCIRRGCSVTQYGFACRGR